MADIAFFCGVRETHLTTAKRWRAGVEGGFTSADESIDFRENISARMGNIACFRRETNHKTDKLSPVDPHPNPPLPPQFSAGAK